MKKFLLIILSVITMGTWAMAQTEPTDSLIFTGNAWEFPVNNGAGLTEAKEFSYGKYTVTVAAPGKYYYNTSTSALLLGKKDATLTLPSFDFPVDSIVTEGVSGASGKVTFNIFVGDVAVSTEVTGATTGHNFAIDSNYSAAGNIYVIKVTNANNLQFTKIYIYGKKEVSPTAVAKPVFSVASGYVKEGTKVSITNPAENDAKVYVSVGEWIEADELAAPKISEENVFAADSALTINAYTVVKAFCATINGTDTVCSDTVSAVYKLIPVLPDLSSVNDIADQDPKAPFIMDCPLTVFYSNNGNVYVTDGNYNGLIYDKALSFEAGAVIKGGWEGNLKNYNGIIEFIPNDAATVTSDSIGTVPQPRPVEAADVAMAMMPNNKLAYVTLQGVHFDESTPAEKGFTGYVVSEPEGTTSVEFYNTFKIDPVPAGVYFVTGIVSCYNTNMQFIPLKYEEPYLHIAFDNEIAQWDSVYVYAENAEGKAVVAWPGQKMDAENANTFTAKIVTTDELAKVCFSNGASEDIDSLQQTGMLKYIADKEYSLSVYDVESLLGQYKVNSFTGKVTNFYDKDQTTASDIDMQPWLVSIVAAPEITNGIVIKKFLNAANEEADSLVATVNLTDNTLTVAPQLYLDEYLLANNFTNVLEAAPFVGTIDENGNINLTGFNVYEAVETAEGEEAVAMFTDVNYTIEKYTDSIFGIATDNAGAAAYYNLQGMKVQNPAKGGIYIRLEGKNVNKVIIK